MKEVYCLSRLRLFFFMCLVMFLGAPNETYAAGLTTKYPASQASIEASNIDFETGGTVTTLSTNNIEPKSIDQSMYLNNNSIKYITADNISDAALNDYLPEYEVGDIFTDCSYCPEIFVMPAGVHIDRHTNVKSFGIMRYEVTMSEFSVFVNDTGYETDAEKINQEDEGCFIPSFSNPADGTYRERTEWSHNPSSGSDDYPVVCVSYNDAAAYANWLSNVTGKMYELPSVLQLEYAAMRFALTTEQYDFLECANNFRDRSFAQTFLGINKLLSCNDNFPASAPAGSFRPNRYSLHDMLGNVAEWTQTCLSDSDDYLSKKLDLKVWGERRCTRSLAYGGAWDSTINDLYADYRGKAERNLMTGFRLVRRISTIEN